MIERGEVAPYKIARHGARLLKTLNISPEEEFYVVFDDVHLVEDSPYSFDLLTALLHAGDPGFSFILISRHLNAESRDRLKQGQKWISLNNKNLAFSRDEIFEFFNTVLEVPVSQNRLNSLFRSTEGWPMGIVLKAHAILHQKHGAVSGLNHPLMLAHSEDTQAYFAREVFNSLPKYLLYFMMQLSFLSEIDVSLARELTGHHGIGEALADLSNRNFFTRCLNREKGVYEFHHLFQQYLRKKAEETIHPGILKQTLVRAASWYDRQGQPEQALDFLIEAGDFSSAENLLKKVGLQLYAENRIITLKNVLERIPSDIVRSHAWLSYFYGVVCMDVNPLQGHPFLMLANTIFRESDDAKGELISATQLILYHILVDGKFSLAEKFGDRAESVFKKVHEELSPFYLILAANSIALCFLVVKENMAKVDHYTSLALELALRHNHHNLIAMARFTRYYQFIFSGMRAAAIKELEELYRLLQSPRISSHSRMQIFLTQASILEGKGDFYNYEVTKRIIRSSMDQALFSETILAPFFAIWDIDQYLAQGDLDQALELVCDSLSLPLRGLNAHFRSQLLHYQAYLYALHGRSVRAEAAILDSLDQRRPAGGIFFRSLHHMMAGGTYGLLNMFSEAEHHLDKAITLGSDVADQYIRPGAYTHRALVRLAQGREAEAAEDIRSLIRCLKQSGHKHIWSWTPRVMEEVFSAAVRLDISPAFVKGLSLRRIGKGFRKNGSLVDGIRIRTLGAFCLELGDKEILSAKELSRQQQALLALLISSPGGMSVESICTSLWPEQDKKRGRTNLDTLLSRLRNFFSGKVTPFSPSDYLCLEKGWLRLDNCIIDAHRFLDLARQGNRHADREHLFQAGNHFRLALSTWKGDYLPDFSLDRQPHEFRTTILEPLFKKCALRWSEIMLMEENPIPEDLLLIEKAVGRDPIDLALVKNICRIHTRAGRAVEAGNAILRYRESLVHDGYKSDDVEEIIDKLWKN